MLIIKYFEFTDRYSYQANQFSHRRTVVSPENLIGKLIQWAYRPMINIYKWYWSNAKCCDIFFGFLVYKSNFKHAIVMCSWSFLIVILFLFDRFRFKTTCSSLSTKCQYPSRYQWIHKSHTHTHTHSLIHWLTDWLTDSIIRWLTGSLTHWLTRSLAHSFTHSRTHPLTHPLTHTHISMNIRSRCLIILFVEISK